MLGVARNPRRFEARELDDRTLRLAGPSRAAHDRRAQRTTVARGARGIAVAKPATELVWRVADGGAGDITQCNRPAVRSIQSRRGERRLSDEGVTS
jgi:hypothetical protein